jgi:DNA (cytosine-5)-methyltransferase 1
VGFHRDAFTGAAGMADGFGWDAHASHRNAAARGRWPGKRDIARDADGRIVQEVVQPPEDLGADLLDLTVGRWFERNGVDDHPNARDVFAVKAGLGRMRQVAEGDTSRKSFKRLHRWRYSPTVAYGNNEVHLHPWLDRRLSVAEAMALQSLPREFELPAAMTLTDKFKTVGNGVPLKLAEALALAIRDAARGRAAMPVRLDPARGRTPVPEAVPMPGAPDLAEAA